MEDIFFIILFGICFLLLCFYLAYKEQGENYMKLLAGVALLSLVWIGGANDAFGPKLMLTGLAISAIYKGYTLLKKNRKVTL